MKETCQLSEEVENRQLGQEWVRVRSIVVWEICRLRSSSSSYRIINIRVQFYQMMKTQKAIKTINLNSGLFSEQAPKKSTLPVNLLRSFVERKRNSKSSKSKVQRYINGNSKFSSLIQKEPEKETPTQIDLPTPPRSQHPGRNTVYHLKTHSKTPTDIHIRKRHNSIDVKEEGQSQKNSFFIHKVEQEQPEQEDISKNTEQDGKAEVDIFRAHQKALEKIAKHFEKEDYQRVNPYTQEEYTYIKHKQKDHLAAIKKTARFRRISSIMQSYKIATIQLTPQAHRRKPSLQPSKERQPFQHHSKLSKLSQKHTVQTPVFRRTIDVQIVSPSPWDWGNQPDYSKDFPF